MIEKFEKEILFPRIFVFEDYEKAIYWIGILKFLYTLLLIIFLVAVVFICFKGPNGDTVQRKSGYGKKLGIAMGIVFLLYAYFVIFVVLQPHENYGSQKGYYIGKLDENGIHGWGAEYSKKKKLVRCGSFDEGVLEGFGIELDRDKKVAMKTTCESVFYKGKASGDSVIRQYKNGFMTKELYVNCIGGVPNGEGRETRYNEKTEVKFVYEGSFSEGMYNGYGMEEYYDESGRLIKKYEGWSYVKN